MALVGKPRRRPGLAPPEEPGSHRQVAQLWTSVVGKRAGFGTRDTRTHKTKSFCVFSSCLWMISVSQHNTSCSTAWEPALVMGECLLMVITHNYLICQCQQVCAEKLIFSEVPLKIQGHQKYQWSMAIRGSVTMSAGCFKGIYSTVLIIQHKSCTFLVHPIYWMGGVNC